MQKENKLLSDIITFSKYAKFIPEKNRRETWDELIDRNIDMHVKKFPHLKLEILNVYDNFVRTKYVLPSMRSLQFAGRPVDISNARIFNCAYQPVDNILAFSELMFLLLSGCGVGVSVEKKNIEKLPTIKGVTKKQRRFLIEDSIIGWADAVKVLMKSYTQGKSDPLFDYRDIRPKGARLVTSGGKAPGADPLRICLDEVRAILNNAVGRKLTTLEAHDIACHIADAVLAGGIRRAAIISFFDADDYDMLSCKSGAWWELNPQRGRANNSVVLDRNTCTEEEFYKIWERVELSGSGEPGFFWTNGDDMRGNPCVSGDTLVTVRDLCGTEPYQIPIKMLVDMQNNRQPLPEALSLNFETGSQEWKQIRGAILTKKDAETMKITCKNGESVVCTSDHKIYTAHEGWVEAGELYLGDSIILSSEKKSAIVVMEIFEKQDVYDICVADNHNFFANGILIHNCVEATLRPHTFCNLVEINGREIKTQRQFNECAIAASFIATLQASYTDFVYLRDVWKESTEEDALIGVGITGIADEKLLNLNEADAADCVILENERVAKLIGINPAKRTCVVKPSGTSSLVLGTSSGIHAYHDNYYIRRFRVGKTEALYKYLMEKIPNLIEDCKFKPHLESVVSFPQKAPEGAITREESVMEFLDRIRRFNLDWVRAGHIEGENYNNVSCTVSVKPDEWGKVGEWMWQNRSDYSGISVLPFDDSSYVQMPFESCTKEQYEEMCKYLVDIDLSEVIEIEDQTDLQGEAACAGGQCEIK